MLYLSRALSRRVVPRIGEEKPKPDGFRTWVSSGSYFIDAESVSNSFKLKNASISELVPHLSYDFERFSFASLESFLGCAPPRNKPKALSWPLLRMYYASFFGAHAIMRAVGRGVFRLEPLQSKKLVEIASLFALNLDADSGTYEFQIIENANLSIDVALTRLSDAGGAHEQFWRRFNVFLSEIGTDISAKGEPDANIAIGEIAQVQSLLSSNGFTAGTWLSATRNTINYQHGLGVWFPYATSAKVQEIFDADRQKLNAPIRLDYNPSKDTIQAFDSCCRAITILSSKISDTICNRKGVDRYKHLWQRLGAEY